MTRTPTLPLDHGGMWRKALARVHPDGGGEHELFIWIQEVRDAMCGGGRTTTEHHPPRQKPRPEPPLKPRIIYEDGRVPFPEPVDFEALTTRALAAADEMLPLYTDLMRILEDCEPVEYEPLRDQQRRGATYKQLAAIGHKVGMSKALRVQWYRIAESVPLSCRHAGHVLSKLKRAET